MLIYIEFLNAAHRTILKILSHDKILAWHWTEGSDWKLLNILKLHSNSGKITRFSFDGQSDFAFKE